MFRLTPNQKGNFRIIISLIIGLYAIIRVLNSNQYGTMFYYATPLTDVLMF